MKNSFIDEKINQLEKMGYTVLRDDEYGILEVGLVVGDYYGMQINVKYRYLIEENGVENIVRYFNTLLKDLLIEKYSMKKFEGNLYDGYWNE